MRWWKLFRRRALPEPKMEVVLQQVLETLECHFALFDPERRLVFHNSSYAKLHAQSWDALPRPLRYDDLMRAAIRNGPPCDDVEAELAKRVAAHEKGGVQHFERLYPDDRWMRVSRCRLPNGYVGGMSLDIGALKAREAATAASEARYRALVDTASVGIWHLDAQGRTLFANGRLAALFGGVAPACVDEFGIEREASDENCPFGFPAGQETRATIRPKDGGEAKTVLVAASGWVPQAGADDAARTTVLTLIDISALEAARAQAEHLAWHDGLTGLSNRAALQRALDALPDEEANGTALLLIDLDEFKAVNDRHGHAAGDALLREVGMRMRRAVRPGDLACRIGGDEFAVLLRGVAGHVGETAARLSRELRRPVEAEGMALPLSASIGYARFPADGANADALQQAADFALYRVKREGRGGVAAYTPDLSEAANRQRRLREALRQALERGEFCLAWQRQAFTAGGRLRGAEALLRWPGSPFGSALSPAEFLPEARQAGLMPAIDAWVLEAALQQMREWSGDADGPQIAGVNMSVASLSDAGFPARVAEALMRHGLPGRRLEIEVPEDIATRDLDAIEHVLTGLRAIGVRVALDNFGGGHSSVAHLVRLPSDLVKLDRSVVAGLPGGARERATLRAVSGLARSMGIPLLAEGVETEAQAFLLRREGCDIVQGFLYGRPGPANALGGSKIESAARA